MARDFNFGGFDDYGAYDDGVSDGHAAKTLAQEHPKSGQVGQSWGQRNRGRQAHSDAINRELDDYIRGGS